MAGRDLVIEHLELGELAKRIPAPALLPRDIPQFTGRQAELSRLAELADHPIGGVAVVYGLAGVGKTALAIHAAHELLTRFPDGQLYADLHGFSLAQPPADPGAILGSFLRRLGVDDARMPVGVEQQSAMLHDNLASRRMLMVLDNASSEQQVRPLLPGTGASLVLVTSRSALPGLEADERIGLTMLPEQDAVVLLSNLSGPERASAEADALHRVRRLCDDLPLALRVAGQYLAANPRGAISEVAEMLADEQSRLDLLTVGDLSVRSAFAVSYNALAPGDARVFRLLGLYPGENFDYFLVQNLADVETSVAKSVVRRLAQASLIFEGEPGIFQIHDLIHFFALEKCREDETQENQEKALLRLVEHFCDLTLYLNYCLRPERFPQLPDAEQDGTRHLSPDEALACFRGELASILAVFDIAATHKMVEQVMILCGNIGDMSTILHRTEMAAQVYGAALAVVRQADHADYAASISVFLGDAQADLGYLKEAVELYDEAISHFRDTGDRNGEGRALNCSALALKSGGDTAKAMDLFDQSLIIMRETGDRHGEGLVLSNLAAAYHTIGRHDEALSSSREAVEIFRETDSRHEEGAALDNIGGFYMLKEQEMEAAPFFKEAAAAFYDSGDLYNAATAIGNFGNICIRLMKFDAAVSAHRLALELFDALEADEGVTEARRNLARAQFLRSMNHGVPDEEGPDLCEDRAGPVHWRERLARAIDSQ